MPKTIIAGGNVEGLPLSEAVSAGGFIFISGLVGCDADGRVTPGGVAAETSLIIDQVESLLHRAGASLEDIVKVNAYLAQVEDFDRFNAAYAQRFAGAPPARITTGSMLTIDARIEMDFTAYVGQL